jgi:DNA invertase Pin-like site-specific DNA recombinase
MGRNASRTRVRNHVAKPTLSPGSATLRAWGHLLGYARASATDQQPQLQADAPEALRLLSGVHRTASGARSDRPTHGQVLDQLRPGDTPVWRLDLLGRSLRHLVDTITSLAE